MAAWRPRRYFGALGVSAFGRIASFALLMMSAVSGEWQPMISDAYERQSFLEPVVLRKVMVRSDWFIDSIAFHYSDGTADVLPPEAESAGNENEPLVLEPLEFIVAVHGRKGQRRHRHSTAERLLAVEFETNRGRKSQVIAKDAYGAHGGEDFTITAGSSQQIWSVEREPGFCRVITRIVERPIPTSTSVSPATPVIPAPATDAADMLLHDPDDPEMSDTLTIRPMPETEVPHSHDTPALRPTEDNGSDTPAIRPFPAPESLHSHETPALIPTDDSGEDEPEISISPSTLAPALDSPDWPEDDMPAFEPDDATAREPSDENPAPEEGSSYDTPALGPSDEISVPELELPHEAPALGPSVENSEHEAELPRDTPVVEPSDENGRDEPEVATVTPEPELEVLDTLTLKPSEPDLPYAPDPMPRHSSGAWFPLALMIVPLVFAAAVVVFRGGMRDDCVHAGGAYEPHGKSLELQLAKYPDTAAPAEVRTQVAG